MRTPLVVCICLSLGTAAMMSAQTRGGTGGTGGGTPTSPGTSTRGTSTPTYDPGMTGPEIIRPIFISGKVTMDDGTPPPEQVIIQTVCNANPKGVGYTDAKGRFSIDLTSRNSAAMFSDASQSGIGSASGGGFGSTMGGSPTMRGSSTQMNSRSSSLNDRSLMGCDLRAYLPGFRSDQISLGQRRSLDNPEVGTIILHRLANVEGTSISVTSAMAPKDAKKAYEKGIVDSRKSRWENAEREYETAVGVYPKYAAAWYQLGLAQEKQDKIADARKSYMQALAADAKYLGPYMQLAMLAVRDKNWKEVADDTDRLLSLNPVDFLGAWYYNAVAHYQLRKLDTAEKSARQGLASDSEHHIAKFDELLAVILVEKQDYAGAAEHMKNYLRMAPEASDAELVKKQLAEVEKRAAAAPPQAAAAAKEKP